MASIIKKCDCLEELWPECEHNWTVRYRDPAGKQKEATKFKRNYKAAEKFAGMIETRKTDGVYTDPKKQRTIVADLFEEWYTGGGKYSDMVTISRKNYESMHRLVIKPFFNTQYIGTLKPAKVKEWMQWMRDTLGYKESTVINRMDVLSVVCNYAVVNEYIVKNPCHGVATRRARVQKQAKQNIVVPSLEQVYKLADAMEDEYEFAVWLMASCGLRFGEVLGISLDQFDFERKVLVVDRQLTHDGENVDATAMPVRPASQAATKGQGRAMSVRHLKHRGDGEYREVPLTDFVLEKLDQHLKRVDPLLIKGKLNFLDGSYLFLNRSRQNVPAGPWFRTNIWTVALRKAGFPAKSIKPHWLRHMFASTALAAGVQIHELSAWMGHASVQVTLNVYGHLVKDSFIRFRDVMEKALRGDEFPLTELQNVTVGDLEADDSLGADA
jgi:integrase